MLRALRRRLREVDYHAAPLPSDPWSRWMRRAVFAALPFGIATVLLGEGMVHRAHELAAIDVGFVQPRPGAVAALIRKDDLGRIIWTADPGWGEGRLVLEAASRGFPVITFNGPPRARLELRRFDETKGTSDASFPADHPVWEALDRALERPDERAILALLATRQAPERRIDRAASDVLAPPPEGRRWGTTAWMAALIGFVFALVATRALRIARYASRLRLAHRAARQRRREATNRCVHCGYDLRGLEWHERCPECGERA